MPRASSRFLSMASAMAERHWLAVQRKRISMGRIVWARRGPANEALRGATGNFAQVASPAMALDPRTPVVVGVGQTLRKPQTAADQPEPAEMMAEALRLAERDSGGAGLLGRAQSVRVVDLLSW